MPWGASGVAPTAHVLMAPGLRLLGRDGALGSGAGEDSEVAGAAAVGAGTPALAPLLSGHHGVSKTLLP